MTVEYARMQQHRGLETELLASGLIPLEGELIVSTDTAKIWVGDGTTPIGQLVAAGGGNVGANIDDTTPSTVSTYSSAKVQQALDNLAATGPGSQVNVFTQNTDGSYPTSGTPTKLFLGATPPDPTTITGSALFILQGS